MASMPSHVSAMQDATALLTGIVSARQVEPALLREITADEQRAQLVILSLAGAVAAFVHHFAPDPDEAIQQLGLLVARMEPSR